MLRILYEKVVVGPLDSVVSFALFLAAKASDYQCLLDVSLGILLLLPLEPRCPHPWPLVATFNQHGMSTINAQDVVPAEKLLPKKTW